VSITISRYEIALALGFNLTFRIEHASSLFES